MTTETLSDDRLLSSANSVSLSPPIHHQRWGLNLRLVNRGPGQMACIREPSFLPGATCTLRIAGTFLTGEETGLDEGLGPIGDQQGPCTLRELVSDSGILPRP